jgi:phage repressor protein C with HTH and peptisase S24 domain
MTHEELWRAIELFADENGFTCSALAKKSGLDPTTFNKSKRFSKVGQPRWPSTQSVSKILEAAEKKFADFGKFLSPPWTEN